MSEERSKSEGSSGKKRRRRSKRGGGKNDDDDDAGDAAAAAADSESLVVDAAPAAQRESDDDDDDDDDVPSRSGGGVAAVAAAAAASDDGSEKDEGGDDDVPDHDDDGVDKESKKRKRKRNRKKKKSGGSDDADGTTSSNVDPSSSDASSSAKRRAELLSSSEHTVFVEGLPFTSTPDQVRHFFEVHGCDDVVDMRLPTWQDSGRLRGFGHVVFGSIETRDRALGDDVNGKELGGRYVTIKEANPPRAGTTMGASTLGGGMTREQPNGCKTVFVRNLPYDASEEDILESFRTFGKVVEGGVRVVRNHVSGTSKGFGYVEYKNEEGALAAVQKAAKPFGLLVMKRPVFVDYDEGTMKGSFRDGEGKLWSKAHDNNGRGGSASAGRGRMGGGRAGGGGRGGGGTGFGGGRGRR